MEEHPYRLSETTIYSQQISIKFHLKKYTQGNRIAKTHYHEIKITCLNEAYRLGFSIEKVHLN